MGKEENGETGQNGRLPIPGADIFDRDHQQATPHFFFKFRAGGEHFISQQGRIFGVAAAQLFL